MHKYWFAHSANKRKLSSLILGGDTENASENVSDIKTCQTGAWLREIYISLYIYIHIHKITVTAIIFNITATFDT